MKKRNLLPVGLLATLLLTASCSTKKQATEQRAEIEFQTTMGSFTMALYNETPMHRDAYLLLTRIGYFDSLLIHRVVDNFVVQGGDPDSKHAKQGDVLGDGEPFRIPAEIHFPTLYHKRGMVCAAREWDDVNPNRESCGSQFAIMTAGPLTDEQIDREEKQARTWLHDSTFQIPATIKEVYRTVGGSPHLDNQFTIFAEITAGMNVVDSMQHVAKDTNDRPLQDIRILKATVVRENNKMLHKTQKK